jgi:hypothetical protein
LHALAPKLKRVEIRDNESDFSFYFEHTFDELSAAEQRVSAKEKAGWREMASECGLSRRTVPGTI